MADFPMTRRAFCLGSVAGVALPTLAGAQSFPPLTARVTHAQIAPEGYDPTEVWSYNGGFPGPEIRLAQGARLQRTLVNELPAPTSIHWHGIRIDNAMDGVAGLTQSAVPTGESFAYDFALPDAGTYWYHAHTNSMEQVARGLYGALIVEEDSPPDVDRDEVLILDDWLLDPETAQLDLQFDHPMALSHGGRFGNLIGTNGRYADDLKARQSERLRLRIINAANARIFVLRLDGLTGWTVALDGMPLENPEPVEGELILAPAQRIDLIVDVTAAPGEQATLLRAGDDDAWYAQIIFDVTDAAPDPARDAPAPLPANPRMALPDLAKATQLEMRMEGGAMSGLRSARYQGQDMDFRALAQQGQFWALSGQSGMGDAPFARFSNGEHVRIKLANDTVFPHAMHLHGMHFRQIFADGTFGPMRDTILSIPNEPIEIGFIADNPGKWLLHCHMLAHAASGMTTWIEVA
ncbi:multicopper oxidase family protein [Actibacterium lipolyticum]|uniref:Multicopper oxidase mco n=1 Tax=Actibacterium lipolyticum TaxID=1524263 RepID=A0A238KF65_9RHOB|nr:multicopper oxidase family protein [Actibacterium lipolyticum]SMX41431.1 Multicopper oxidase mco [Actibacterium lipolyticum]